MFRFNRVSVTACLLVVGGLVAVSYGAATKIREFVTFDPEPIAADGMAILNYITGQNETVIQVILGDFTADTAYQVRVESPAHCLTPTNGITTDSHGHGTLHITLGVTPAFGDCAADGNGDWSDADIVVLFEGVERGRGYNLG